MIRFENVSFSYDGTSRAIDDVSLNLAEGSFTCILGGNGSGKSTLAKHMNALLVPDEGRVFIDGLDASDEDEIHRIRRTAGMVFQNPDDQLVASLVEDDVAFGPENLGVETEELARRVKEALREVGLVGFEKHGTAELSGGQKQRVAIAGVLAMQPKVLVLDEASAMLDPRGRAGLRRVCRNLHERGMTIVMITHFMEETADADRVVVLEKGRIVLDGTPEEVLVRDNVLARLNLETPFSVSCSRALAARGVEVAPCIDEEQLAAQIKLKFAEAPAASAPEAAAPQITARGAKTTKDAASSPAATDHAGKADETANAAAPLLEFKNVSFTYDVDAEKKQRKSRRKRRGKDAEAAEHADWGKNPDAVWALRDVSFAINAGEFFGIAGHTGSGKSTLVQHMNGLLRPTTGQILLDGAGVEGKAGAAAMRSKIGMVFQYPEHQLFADTVRNDVAFGPRNLGLSEDEVDARVRRALERVGLPPDEIGEKSPFELSGGQQRRVAFAGVLAMEPSALVLDEPAAGLDPAARRSFLSLIKKLHEDGLTVVMVSHNMDDLAAMCDRIAVLNEGSLVQVAMPQEVFLQAERMHSIGLGVPAPQQLANRLREGNVPLSADKLYDTDSLADDIASLLHSANRSATEGATR